MKGDLGVEWSDLKVGKVKIQRGCTSSAYPNNTTSCLLFSLQNDSLPRTGEEGRRAKMMVEGERKCPFCADVKYKNKK